MSTLTKVLERNIKVIEKNADLTEGRFRLGHHLMPPVGWLNDPNGLCWYKGRYHPLLSGWQMGLEPTTFRTTI